MVDAKDVERLVAVVLKSAKYGEICPELIRSVGARELGIRRSFKEAVKATKNKLHQVGGAYFEKPVDYVRALREVRHAAQAGDAVLREVCETLMGLHTSTKERVPILEEFYAETLGPLNAGSVLDLACGLNPLAIPWMPLAEGATYYACDIYRDMMAFVDAFLEIAGVAGEAAPCDLTRSVPRRRVDVALILKAVPCLEQLDKNFGVDLLEAVDAHHLLVSFPVHSLTGKSKGMVENYTARFHDLVRGRPWPVRRFEFESELAFLLTKEVGI